jgi:cellobiose phosphorylase
MRFGHFYDERREYVITTPLTPRPWINYLGSEQLFSMVSHLGGGTCFYRDARLRRILRYRHNNVPTDLGGRYFYIRDGATVWSPTWMPVKTELDRYECAHGLGYTRIRGERRDLSAEVMFCVPLGDSVELHRLALHNRSRTRRRITVFSFLEFCLWDASDDATNLQRNLNIGEVEVDGGTIYHVTGYRERRDHFAFYHAGAPIVGFDTDRDAFLGPYRGLHEPHVVATGRSQNSIASGGSPIASHALEIELLPGELRAIVFALGYVENPRDAKWSESGGCDKRKARAVIDKYADAAAVDRALVDLGDHWSRVLDTLHVESRDLRFDRMVNVWNPYQCMTTYHMSRSASYFETGVGRGIGFRDANQDLLGLVQLAPERARERLVALAATQLADGSAYHQVQPLTWRGNDDIGSGFNDDPLWLILAAGAYVRETGDLDVLDEPVPFADAGDVPRPLLEHLRRALGRSTRMRGPNGLPLIGRADWNDCLNLNCFSRDPDESFQTAGHGAGPIAESVFLGALYVLAARDYAALAEARGHVTEAACARSHAEQTSALVLARGWDGNWFLRAFDASSEPVGGAASSEGRIFIEPQAMCAMAGIGVDTGRARRALDAVAELLESEHGAALVAPAYRRYRVELGEITSYPPGYKENGAVFCHTNSWLVIAETILGRAERAFQLYQKFTPAYFEDRSDVHQLEPYVYAQMIAGPEAPRPGEAKNSWLTGTAAWAFVAVTQHMLGIRPQHDGLRIEPCLPAELLPCMVTRRCRGAEYRISILAGTRTRLVVDGRPLVGAVVPYAEAGTVVDVECQSADAVGRAMPRAAGGAR